MSNDDQIEVEILEDGTIKIQMDKISPPNHMNAEQVLRNIQELTGGKATRKHKQGKEQKVQHGQHIKH
jgi:hypothetical protein